MTPEELKELARRILNKEVFGTWDIAPHDFDNYVKLIFLPIAFGAEPSTNRFAAFAPYTDRIQTQANPGGYPCFSSVQFIVEEDYDKLVKILVAAEKAQEEAIEVSK
jgi:hypothetical protein